MGTVYCDFDGTIICGDIEREFINFLRKKKYLSFKNYIVATVSIPVNKIRRIQKKGSIFKGWTFGLSNEKIDSFIEEFIKNTNEIIINKKSSDLLKELSKENKVIILTGSYEKLVKAYLKESSLSDCVDLIIGCVMKKNGFIIDRHPYGLSKCKFITEKNNTIGIANEFADGFYLLMCSEAYVISGDEKLEKLAKENNWRLL